jgi:hypothetical protein
MKKLIPYFFLGASFGIIEASVVIVLRPHFSDAKAPFALKLIAYDTLNALQETLLSTELWREAATIVLLAAAAAIAARTFLHWASYFVFTFGIWDIFYYIWLSLKIGWPHSLLDWDILFLIPKMWLAPVLVPCMISLTGIIMSMIMVRTLSVRGSVRMQVYHWAPVLLALLLWLISFLNKSEKGMTAMPQSYSWWLFILGLLLCIGSTFMFYREQLYRHKSFMFRTRG